MWLPLGGLNVRLDNYVMGIRFDHLLHASVYLPCVWMLLPLTASKLPRSIAVSLTLCMLTEWVQWLLPYRGFDINDLVANIVGVLIGVLPLLLKRRQR